MGLDSLLASLNRGVAAVTDVQPLRHKALACNGTESAGVAGIAEAMSGGKAATAATGYGNSAVTRKPLQHKACTAATAATAENIEVRSRPAIVGDVKLDGEPISPAIVAEYDRSPIHADAELLPWPEDDRRHCRQCVNLRGETCSIATPGGIVSANKGYRPVDLPNCCAGFSPSMPDVESHVRPLSDVNHRMNGVAAKLSANDRLRYAMNVHDDASLDAVILSLAIKGQAVCELRIPRSKYEAFELLELIERHTTQGTLQ